MISGDVKIKISPRYKEMCERPTIVITAPHAACTKDIICYNFVRCEEEFGRMCDTNARTAAKILYDNFLRYEAEVDPIVFVNEVTKRDWCDMNRIECRKTYWRSQITTYLSRAAVVLDIHSFPAHTTDFGVRTDVVFLTYKSGVRNLDLLVNELNFAGINTRILPGESYENDIIHQAHQKRVPIPLLIEFSEDLTPEQLDNISKFIVTFILDLLKYLDC